MQDRRKTCCALLVVAILCMSYIPRPSAGRGGTIAGTAEWSD